MVHGAGGGGWEFDFWKPVFARAGWTVKARDLMPSRGGLAATTYADYEAQVVAWCRSAKRPLVVVGASMGGGLAQSTLTQVKPDLLILVGSVAPKKLDVERRPTSFPPIVKWANGPFEDTRLAMPDSTEKTQRWAWKRWRDESGQVMATLSAGVSASRPQCPTLVVWGAEDADIPLATGHKLAMTYQADLQAYGKTSHVGPLMGTRAGEIATNVVAWIRSRLPVRR